MAPAFGTVNLTPPPYEDVRNGYANYLRNAPEVQQTPLDFAVDLARNQGVAPAYVQSSVTPATTPTPTSPYLQSLSHEDLTLLANQGNPVVRGPALEELARRNAAPAPTAEAPTSAAPTSAAPRTWNSPDVQKIYKQFKAALTRAQNTQDPAKILTETSRFFDYYNNPNNEPMPDDWSRWQRAKDDAEHQIARVTGTGHFVDPTQPLTPPTDAHPLQMEQAPPVVRATSLMGIPVTFAKGFTDDNNIHTELYRSPTQQGVIRQTDLDSGNVITIKRFPHYDHAVVAFQKLREVAPEAEPEATIEGTDGTEPGPGHPAGTGQLPVGGGATTVRGGVGRPGPLGTVPTEGDTAAQGEGPERPAYSDSEGVVVDELPREPADGAESVDEPAASFLPGTEPVVVSPSGTDHDPGNAAPDYTLTDERIRTIIDRGPVVRAEDNLRAIKLLKQLTAENRYATVDEQEILAKYVGWGANDMAERLGDEPKASWSANETRIWQELRDVLTEEERENLRESSPYAHFTYDLYGPMWQALVKAGFTGGRVLEPSVGTGHAFGLMPPDMRHASVLNGVELEPITAGIAHHLYPSARIQAVGYEQARIARNSQDVMVGNPPFGDFGLTDKRMPHIATRRIHSYFFAKALEHLRPGGLLAFIATHFMLDGTDPEQVELRRYLMDRAEFVGAVRLPNTAFDKSAKTKVVTDIIVLRKLREGETAANAKLFIESPKHEALSATAGYDYRTGRSNNVYRSSWYDAHPDLVVGKESTEGQQRRENEYTVGADADYGPDAIEQALARVLRPGTYQPATDEPAQIPGQKPQTPTLVEGRFKPGQLRMSADGNGIVTVAEDATTSDATPMKDGKVDVTAVRRIKGMIGVRDARNAVVAAMRDPKATDEQIKALQKKLRNTYDAFVVPKSAKPNYLNQPVNKRLFSRDPESANLLGLETLEYKLEEGVNKEGKKTFRLRQSVTGQSDIFTKRTIGAERQIDHVETPKDALLASLGVRGRIDWPFMAQIAGVPVADLKASLQRDGLVYEQPDGSVILAQEYLSGDVVTKLEDAEAAADAEPDRFAPNVAALKAVQPAPKTLDDIAAQTVQIGLGAHWIPTTYLGQFVADQLGVTPRDVKYRMAGTEVLVRWDYNATRGGAEAGARHPLAVHYDFDVPFDPKTKANRTYSYLDLVHDTLNLQQPELGHWEGSKDNRHYVKEPDADLAARANQETLRKDWTQWLVQNPEIAQHLLDLYNERFTRTVERTYDGSHMQYPGMATLYNSKGEEVHFYKHQNDGVWRILTSGNTLLAHEVGAGKTFEMIAAAMEMRRTGRARKPMIVVPTYLLSSWRADIIKLYPTAKLLAFDEKDLEKSKRQAAMARIAHGDWDMVLVPHSSFQLLRVSDERMDAMRQEWIDELTAVIMAEHQKGNKKDPNVKQMERLRRKIQDKIKKKEEQVTKSTDTALTWEELGVDALMVDEAQAFKNLYYFTKIENLRGLSRSESDRALDLYVKVRDINDQSGHRNLVLATATPVMNSIAEIFTMQRYLQPQTLQHYGVDNFDNWYTMFAKALPTTERQPDGSYKEVMRLRDYQNLGVLSKMVREVMDYVGWDDMPYLKLPKIKGGKIDIVQTEQHPMYPLIMDWLKSRMSRLKAMPPHVDFNGDYIAPERLDPITGEPMMGIDKKTGQPKKLLDNILTVMTDAKKAAVDVRLILGDRAKDWPGSRLQTAADMMVKEWKAEAPHKGVILTFLDLGTPKTPTPLSFLTGSQVEDETEGATDEEGEQDETDAEREAREEDDPVGFNLYDALRNALIKRGVPPNQIAYIHQAKNSAERLALFQAANEGKVRFVFASTDKGGVGMNIQTRMSGIYEIDAPRAQRPGDLRQRMGRGIRQGNDYYNRDGVHLARFVTKGTTDEWLWGLLTQKDYMLRKFYRGEISNLTEPDDPSTMSLEQAQMLSSQDPRAIELIELQGKIPRLEAQGLAGESALAKARSGLQKAKQQKTVNEADYAAVSAWLKTSYTPLRGDAFKMTIGGTTHTKRADAETAVLRKARELIERDQSDTSVLIGEVGSLPLYMRLTAWNAPEVKAVPAMNREAVPARREYRVHFYLDGSVFNGGSLDAGTLPYSSLADISTLGAGVNVIAPIVNAYEKTAAIQQSTADAVERSTNEIAQHERTLAHPPTAIAELTRARARVIELETAMRQDAVAESKERDAAAKAEVDAKKAAAAANQPKPVRAEDEGDEEDGESGPERYHRLMAYQTAVKGLKDAAGSIQATLAPAGVNQPTKASSRYFRYRLAQQAHTAAYAANALSKYRNAVERMTVNHDQILDLADAVENPHGSGKQVPANLQPWIKIRDEIYDHLKQQIADLGIDKDWKEHYLGHVWEQQFKPDAPLAIGRRPLGGPAGFMRRQKIPTMREGVQQLGKVPKTWNLVDIDLYKMAEMAKFILAKRTLADNKRLGTFVWVRALTKPPDRMIKVPDIVGAVYAPPELTVREAYDKGLMEGLESFITQLGVNYKRTATAGKLWGASGDKTGDIKAKFGGPVEVLMHEAGHTIDTLFDLRTHLLAATPDAATELEALAKLRIAGQPNVPQAYQDYLQEPSEQIANLVFGYLYNPTMTRQVAPNTYAAFQVLIANNPQLQMLPDLQTMRTFVFAEREAKLQLPGPMLLGNYYAPPEVAKVFHNYLEPGLGAHKAFGVIRALSTASVQAKLMLSAFHAFTVTLESASMEAARGLGALARGRPLRAIQHLAGALGEPVAGPWRGGKHRAEYLGTLDPSTLAWDSATNLILSGGGRVEQSREYTNRSLAKFMDNLRRANEAYIKQLPARAGKEAFVAALRFVPAMVELSAYPIMQMLVPRAKAGAMVAQIVHDLEGLPGVPTQQTMLAIASKASDLTDATLGEVVWDNRFLPRALLNVLQYMIMSPGWRFGSAILLYKGITDPVRRLAPSQRETYTVLKPPAAPPPPKGGKPQPPLPKQTPTSGGPTIDVSEEYFSRWTALVIGTVMIQVLASELYQLAHGAGHIGSIADVALPRTGEYRYDGTPERVKVPGYSPIFYSILRHLPRSAVDYILGGNSPLPTAIGDWYHNETPGGVAITDPGDPWRAQLIDYSKWMARELFEPIAFTSYGRRSGTTLEKMESLSGVSPAARRDTMSDAERLMSEYLGPPHMSKEQAELATERRNVREAVREGKSGQEADAPHLGGKQIAAATKTAFRTPLEAGLSRPEIDFTRAAHIYEAATPDERGDIRMALIHKAIAEIKKTPYDQQAAVVTRRDALLALPFVNKALPKASGQ